MKAILSAVAILLAVFSFLSPTFAYAEVELTPSEQANSEGYFTLRWKGSVSESMVLEMSTASSFDTVEHQYPVTRLQSITLSGYDNGLYHFRLYDPEKAEYSNAVTVSVEHRSLSLAIKLFFLGAVLFVTLVVIILFSSRKNNSI